MIIRILEKAQNELEDAVDYYNQECPGLGYEFADEVFPANMKSSYAGKLDYQSFLEEAGDCSGEEMVAFLLEELPYLWCDIYREMTSHQTNICCLRHGSFEYIFDDLDSLEASGAVPYDPKAEARLVAVLETTKRVRSTEHRL